MFYLSILAQGKSSILPNYEDHMHPCIPKKDVMLVFVYVIVITNCITILQNNVLTFIHYLVYVVSITFIITSVCNPVVVN
jgi:hypothetical protein